MRRNLKTAKPRRAGYTLLEVIVTLSIIVMLGGIVMYSGGFGLGGLALDRAASDIHMLLRSARSRAILDGRDARLIINYDASDPKRYLRFAGIMVRHGDELDRWVAVHGGIYLPEGVNVVPQSGPIFEGAYESSTRKSIYKTIDIGGIDAVCSINYPLIEHQLETSSGSEKWIVFQFSPDGAVSYADVPGSSSGAAPSGNQIVLSQTSRAADGSIIFSDPEQIRGVIIRQNGTSIASNHPDDFRYPKD